MRNKCECPVDQRSHQQAYDEGKEYGLAQAVRWVNLVDVRKFAISEARALGASDPIPDARDIAAFVLGDLPS